MNEWKTKTPCPFCESELEIFYKDIDPWWTGIFLNKLKFYVDCPRCKEKFELNKLLVDDLKVFEKLGKDAYNSLPKSGDPADFM